MTAQIDLKSSLLEPVATTVVPASTAPVVIRDYFKKNAGPMVSTIFAEFKKRFFDKTEAPMVETTYHKFKLLRISADGPVITELGGESKVEGMFTAAFALVKLQPRGERGFLQTNGYANI